MVKVWADPMSDAVVVSNGWNLLTRLDGLTGARLPFPVKGMDIAFGPAGNIYVYGQKGWHELVEKYTRDFKKGTFPATGKSTTSPPTGTKDVYGRYGWGWCNKGICVGPRGRILAYNMYDWAKYFINAWDASGKAEKHGRVKDGLVGPLDSRGGGVRLDARGNVYVGMHGLPRNIPLPDNRRGAVVKFPPEGGGYAADGKGKTGIPWHGGLMGFVGNGVTVYPGLAPQVGGGCVCREARFDLDGYGRVYVPNGVEYYVRIYDNRGNEVLTFGHYGNPDCLGPGSAVPDPPVGLGWPVSVSARRVDQGRVYAADTLNARILRVRVTYTLEETCGGE